MAQPIIVVGGGLIGSAVALELARRGHEVTVLAGAVPGAEASSAAAGILAPRVEAHGDPEARRLGLESLALYAGFVHRLGADVGFEPCGALVVSESRPDPDASLIEGDALAVRAPGLAAERAWWLPEEARLDPRRLLAAVQSAALAESVAIRRGDMVRRVHPDAVELTEGRLAGRVVACAGAWTAQVHGLDTLPVRPIRGQIAALDAAPGLHTVVFGAGGYLVPRHHELVVGSTMEDVGFDVGVTAGGMHRVLSHALTLMPTLATHHVKRTWSGFRPGTPDGKPLVGLHNGVLVCAGHGRNGVLLAPLTARVVADALEGAATPTAWSPERFLGAGPS